MDKNTVMARWRGYKTWFSGEVRKVYKDRRVNSDQILLDIKYDDGEIEVTCLVLNCESV